MYGPAQEHTRNRTFHTQIYVTAHSTPVYCMRVFVYDILSSGAFSGKGVTLCRQPLWHIYMMCVDVFFIYPSSTKYMYI